MNFYQRCGERRWKKFHRVFPTSFYSECGESRWIFFFTAFLELLKNALPDKWLKPLTSWLFPTPFSTAPTLMYFYHISCEFRKTLETECSEFLSEMRWKTVKKISSRISYIFLQRMWWIAVNFFFTAFLVLLKKGTSWQVVKTSHLLFVSNSLFHCANSHVLLSYFLWIQENVRNRMQWIFIRDAVKGGEKNSSRISYRFLQRMRWIAVNYLLSWHSRYYLKKTLLDKWLEPLTSWMVSTPYSTAPTLMYFYHISCEFRKTLETECSEFLCGERRWKKTLSRISYIFLKRLRWIALNYFFSRHSWYY